jgi:Ca2+-binding EF-hand superfamily protein
MTRALFLGPALAFAAALTLATAADARGGDGAQGPHNRERGAAFEMLDVDGDGFVTEAEIEARRAERFAAIDTDGNGEISAAELQAHAEMRRGERFERMVDRLDTDGSGGIAREEFGRAGQRRGPAAGEMFARLDADGDGRISAAEFEARGERHGPRWR